MRKISTALMIGLISLSLIAIVMAENGTNDNGVPDDPDIPYGVDDDDYHPPHPNPAIDNFIQCIKHPIYCIQDWMEGDVPLIKLTNQES